MGHTGPMPAVALVPYTADLLPAVRPWFAHPEVRRRLGGPDWPERELRLLAVANDPADPANAEPFRGRRVLRAHSWVALDGAGAPVAKVGGEVYDRWCRYTPRPAGPVVDRVEPGPAMGLAYVVDPARWGRGYGRAALAAAVGAAEVADVRVFALGAEADNAASLRCAAAAGFAVDDPEPDGEGIVYLLRRRPVGPPP